MSRVEVGLAVGGDCSNAVSWIDDCGRDAVALAAIGGHLDCLDLLLDNNFTTTAVDAQGLNPLMAASRAGQHAAVVRLLEHNRASTLLLTASLETAAEVASDPLSKAAIEEAMAAALGGVAPGEEAGTVLREVHALLEASSTTEMGGAAAGSASGSSLPSGVVVPTVTTAVRSARRA